MVDIAMLANANGNIQDRNIDSIPADGLHDVSHGVSSLSLYSLDLVLKHMAN